MGALDWSPRSPDLVILGFCLFGLGEFRCTSTTIANSYLETLYDNRAEICQYF